MFASCFAMLIRISADFYAFTFSFDKDEIVQMPHERSHHTHEAKTENQKKKKFKK